MGPRDIGLFLRSARTDARIKQLLPTLGQAATFDAVYTGQDPWASSDSRYRYQRHKYDVLAALLPPVPYRHALDIGCGLGDLARRLAVRCEQVLGIDISQAAADQAAERHRGVANLRFALGDVLALPAEMDGQFDLVVVADTLYYLPGPIEDATLKRVAMRLARLLAPGGTLLLANHFFFAADPDSRLSRRIHSAFAWSPGLRLVSEHRRPFYLASILAPAELAA
jgi:SAM-dependent methyltransferase